MTAGSAYYNAIQIYPWSDGALYQVYAAPGKITDIALEPGENLTGTGPIAAGDTARWIIGDTESGSGETRRVHVLVKPSRADITTNLVITTNRRTYLLELRSGPKPYMPSVSWSYANKIAGNDCICEHYLALIRPYSPTATNAYRSGPLFSAVASNADLHRHDRGVSSSIW